MNHSNSLFIRTRIHHILIALVVGLALSACKHHGSSSAAAAPARIDACALVSADMLAKFSSGLGTGHISKTPIPNVSVCTWKDDSHLPALILTVSPANPAGVAKGLETGMANMGYRIVSIKGLGDEAAVAIQIPNPKYHTKAGIADLEVRVGKRQFGYSPMRPGISGINTPAFAKLKRLASETIAKLRSAHPN